MRRIITREDAWSICEDRFRRPAREIAQSFGCNEDLIYLIWRNKRHANLGHPNQYDDSKPRLTKTDHDAILRLRGRVSPEEVAAQYKIATKTVLNIWRKHG